MRTDEDETLFLLQNCRLPNHSAKAISISRDIKVNYLFNEEKTASDDHLPSIGTSDDLWTQSTILSRSVAPTNVINCLSSIHRRECLAWK